MASSRSLRQHRGIVSKNVSGVCPLSQQVLDSSDVASGAGERQNRVVVGGGVSVDVRSCVCVCVCVCV
jgi:hypothetical protein